MIEEKQLLQSAGDGIAVIGVGTVSSAGIGFDELWMAALEGKVAGTQASTSQIPGCHAPAILAFPPHFRRLRHVDRSAQLAWVAADEAFRQAGVGSRDIAADRIGVVVGSSRGPSEQWASAVEQFSRGRVRPTSATHGTISSLSGALSLAFQARGPSFTISAACASGAAAIAQAADLLLLDRADIMIAGGAEAPLHPTLLAQLQASGILGSHENPTLTCRPFDSEHNGTIIGEGAGFVVLERLSSAQERGARPLAILSGWALGTDAHSRAAGDASGAGLARVVKTALERAGLDAGDIGYANLHGTGTVVNDRLEAAAMRELGPAAAKIPCSSTKPVTGHCLGATSAMEVILCIKALEERVLPPSANCQQVDPACANLRLIETALAAPDIRHAISLSSGFWSNHAALILSGWQP